MEKLEEKNKWQVYVKWAYIKSIFCALWLALWASNFSFSQENGWKRLDTTEQVSQLWWKNIETYRIRVENRNQRIKWTNETLEEFIVRLWNEFAFEANNNGKISQIISEIKTILNNKYSQNIRSDDPLVILQKAIKQVENMEKYKWMINYTNNFSWDFDINFIDALWYIQYINDLSVNWSLVWANWETTLKRILDDLNNWWNIAEITTPITNTVSHPVESNSNISGEVPTQNKPEQEKPVMSIKNKVNTMYSDYTKKVNTRNEKIQHTTNETLDDFVSRINGQFLAEFNNKNSLIAKKTYNIKNILNNRFNQKINSDDPVIILQLALKELSTTEKYKWLKEYTNKFSWKFDINFINGYWLIQYLNDWNCNWVLCGNDWAFILQSIYDDLNNIENIDLKISEKPNNNEIPGIEPDIREMEWIILLSNKLSINKLNWVTYEDVWNTINSFKHEWLRNAVMECLLKNDVVWAQRLLWMDINCSNRYPNYVASLKIWQRELELMWKLWESRRYMDTQEILNFMLRLEKAYEIDNYQVKTTYLKFLSWELNNDWLPYSIISKYDYKIYLFSADHKLLSCQPVLTWAHIWNHPNNPMWWYHTTPKWMYEIWWVFDKSSEGKNLTSVYWTDYILLIPKEWQYVYSSEYTMGMHGYVKWRERRLSSHNTIDHRVSNWCINFDREKFWEIINHIKAWGKVCICWDDEM